MNQNRLFFLTRWRLAGLYAGVMGIILSLSGLCAYQWMAHADWQALDQELESVAGTLHDGLEPKLKQPGQIESSVEQLLPSLCLADTTCPTQPTTSTKRHILGAVQQDGYYLRFLDLSGRTIATLGQQPEGIPPQVQQDPWQTLQDSTGNRYHQVSLLLKTDRNQPWGYMQIGRSLRDFDAHLSNTKIVLLIGLPVAMLLVSVASWWLAGLAMRPVYQSYHQIQQFTADAAHELRTPLAAIRATVESTLDADDLTVTDARGTLQTIDRQNHRLSQLVQDLLLLSRMDLNVLTLKRQSCCLNDVVNDLVEEFAALAIAANLRLTTHIQVYYPLYILGDEEQLYRLIANLINNAIQYTPRGEIKVLLNRDDHHALVQVQDTGIGIAPEDQPHLFDRFYRVNRDRSRQTGGAGLGLAIASAIAQAHHGEITIKSELGKGSTFTVRLPILGRS
ncbi:two-component system sensor histidine kinase RppB [Phormidesmis priestleyi]